MEFVVLPKKWDAIPTVSVFHREFWLKNVCFFIKVGRFFTNHKIHQNQEFVNKSWVSGLNCSPLEKKI